MTEKRTIRFVLPLALPSLNVSLRKHWAERSKDQKMLHQEILAAFGPRYWPRPPFEKALVTVTRFTLRQLDTDNLVASVKPLVDLMKPRSERNPMGMGWLVDDDPNRCLLDVRQVAPVSGEVTQTWVSVCELDYSPPPPKPKRTRAPRPFPPKRPSARAKAAWARAQRP